MQEINYTQYVKPSDYVKFAVGDNTLVIVSKGYFRKLHGMKTARGYIPLGECLGVDCKYCAEGSEPKMKYTWIVYVPSRKEVKILDAGTMIGNQICELARDKGMDPISHEVIINRQGTSMRTQYTVLWGKKHELTAEEQKIVDIGKKYLVKKHFSPKEGGSTNS